MKQYHHAPRLSICELKKTPRGGGCGSVDDGAHEIHGRPSLGPSSSSLGLRHVARGHPSWVAAAGSSHRILDLLVALLSGASLRCSSMEPLVGARGALLPSGRNISIVGHHAMASMADAPRGAPSAAEESLQVGPALAGPRGPSSSGRRPPMRAIRTDRVLVPTIAHR